MSDTVEVPVDEPTVVEVATGQPGPSAYQVAVAAGFEGTAEEWLASLVGPEGEQGPAGEQGPQGPAGEAGPAGEQGPAGADGATGADGAPGADGKSAYEVAVAEGFEGDETAWLASLVGPQGPAGADGAPGEPGEKGDPGEPGAKGDPGEQGPAGPTAVSEDAGNLATLGTDSLLYVGKPGVEDIDASGTPSSSTFLRGDGTWETPAGGGGGSALEVRHASDSTYSYMGTAPDSTGEDASGWTVTRITLTSPPVIETGAGVWDDRASLSYS